jgi:hypothetical protein
MSSLRHAFTVQDLDKDLTTAYACRYSLDET